MAKRDPKDERLGRRKRQALATIVIVFFSVLALTAISINLLVDLVYTQLDPRVRYTGD